MKKLQILEGIDFDEDDGHEEAEPGFWGTIGIAIVSYAIMSWAIPLAGILGNFVRDRTEKAA